MRQKNKDANKSNYLSDVLQEQLLPDFNIFNQLNAYIFEHYVTGYSKVQGG